MPRAKVRPENRQRSEVACAPCKRAKIRCNSELPCATCVKRGREANCIYQGATPNNHQRRASRLSNSTNDRLSGYLTRPTPETSVNSASSIPEGDHGPRSRMLLSSKLQKVYIGEAASLSYLQFLRRIVKHRLGPCSFTEGDFNNYMLESDEANKASSPLPDPELHERQALTQCYLDATSGVLDFHLETSLVGSLGSPEAVIGLATTYLSLAIGAQSRGTSTDLVHASSYFAHGRSITFQGMLCDPSLEMVRNFLLMSFYMLGACHRNAAFMYIGVAAKAASALGLHQTEQSQDLSRDEYQLRSSTWQSLRVLDAIVNSILGRSNSLLGMLAAASSPERDAGNSNESSRIRAMALKANFDICPFMDELESSRGLKDIISTEAFLQRLQKWSQSLPAELLATTEAGPTTSREAFIGGSHVACVYYFVVILATRRFLTVYLLENGQLKESTSTDKRLIPPTVDEKTMSLAMCCLDAAVSLAKVGYNVMISGQMPSSMCLMKAWMFAAGLLLGFSSFAHCSNSDEEIHEAFSQVREVLNKLAEHSLQAGHYYEILTAFSDAIASFQKKVAGERKRVTSRYMDHIFAPNLTSLPASTHAANVDLISPQTATRSEHTHAAQYTDASTPSIDNMGSHSLLFSQEFPWPADTLSFDWETNIPFFEDTF